MKILSVALKNAGFVDLIQGEEDIHLLLPFIKQVL